MANGVSPNETSPVFLLLCLFLVLIAGAAWLLTSHSPDKPQERQVLDPQVFFLMDPGGELRYQDVIARKDWQINQSARVLNFGFTRDSVWIRSPTTTSVTGVRFLVIPYPLLEFAALYLIDPARQQVLSLKPEPEGETAGTFTSHYKMFPIPAHLPANTELLLQVHSSTSLQVPLEFWSSAYLINRQMTERLVWGLYFGAVLALIAYNAFLLVSIREPAYGYYLLYMAAMTGLMLCLSGLGRVYFWGDGGISHYALPVSAGLASLFALLFTRRFLHWGGFPPRLDKAMLVAGALSVVMVLYSLYNPALGAQLSGWVSALVVALVILAGLTALAAGVVIARYFVLAWAVFALGVSLYLLNIFGVIHVSRLTTHAVQAGAALEAILLSLALAHRIKEARQQRLQALENQRRAEQENLRLQSQALELARHDAATQMPNEVLLMSRLQALIDRGAGSAVSEFALVMMHLPQMKEIASSLGRGLAENLFRSQVRTLNHALSSHPVVISIESVSHSYLAVTEFGTLIFLLEDATNYELLIKFARSAMTRFNRSRDLDYLSVNFDVYSALVRYPEHGEQPDMLLQHVYAARDYGLRINKRVCNYSAEIDAYGRRRLALIGELSEAIRVGELELYMQPQINCRGMRLVGAEMLLRWNNIRYGKVPTQEFIGIAESAGMMGHLTRFVVRRSLGLLRQMHDKGMPLTLSINLSVQNLVEPDFVTFVIDTARELHAPLDHVVLEVTETALIENIILVIDNLRLLAASGCSIALDDFGTGYSSLAYLSRLPIHELKIDRSFIAQMGNSRSDFWIVENTVELARALNIQTVAEGVEDALALNTLAALGCNRVQGYHLGFPMPVAEFEEWALQKVG